MLLLFEYRSMRFLVLQRLWCVLECSWYYLWIVWYLFKSLCCVPYAIRSASMRRVHNPPQPTTKPRRKDGIIEESHIPSGPLVQLPNLQQGTKARSCCRLNVRSKWLLDNRLRSEWQEGYQARQIQLWRAQMGGINRDDGSL